MSTAAVKEVPLSQWIKQLGSSDLVQNAYLLAYPKPAGLASQVVLAHAGEPISQDEGLHIIDGVRKANLHTDYITVAKRHYIVTSIQRTSYYGRNVVNSVEAAASTTDGAPASGGGGIVVIRCKSLLIVVTYIHPTAAQEIVPFAELFADKMLENGR